MEDVRTQHDLLRVNDVNLAPLPDVMASVSTARVQILNHRLRSPLLGVLAKVPGLFFDTARVESTDGVPALLQATSADRVMFGSHAPFLIPEAALIRVHECASLDDRALRGVLAASAELFARDAERMSPADLQLGLPAAGVLEGYRIWDSYFTPSHSHPGRDGRQPHPDRRRASAAGDQDRAIREALLLPACRHRHHVRL